MRDLWSGNGCSLSDDLFIKRSCGAAVDDYWARLFLISFASPPIPFQLRWSSSLTEFNPLLFDGKYNSQIGLQNFSLITSVPLNRHLIIQRNSLLIISNVI